MAITDFYKTYIPYIKEFIRMNNVNKILVGHVISFRYLEDTHKINPELVLVLTPNFRKKLWGIKLNNLTVHNFKAMKSRISTKQMLNDELGEPNEVTDIFRYPLKSEANAPQRFYKAYIKTDIRFKQYSIYRTYLLKKITSLDIVSLNFKKLGVRVNYAPDTIKLFPSIEFLNE